MGYPHENGTPYVGFPLRGIPDWISHWALGMSGFSLWKPRDGLSRKGSTMIYYT